jgi:D-xylose transport system ATP-binding protein
MPASAPLVEVKDVWKSFGEVAAIRGASMWANRGELTAIVGDNGAGKSTLIKCISGIHVPDQGSIYLAGTAVTYRGPEEARHQGIETVYQDLALIDDLAVYQNVFLCASWPAGQWWSGPDPSSASLKSRYRLSRAG